MTKPKRLADKLFEIEQRAKGRKPVAPDKPMAKASAKVIKLPAWPDAERTIPNHLARASLFAPVARGRRRFHVRAVLPSRADVRVEYTGYQLDEADCDVWMQALHEARRAPLGQSVRVNRAEFLRAIGRATGTTAYEWLHASFRRLREASIYVETKRYTAGTADDADVLNLVKEFKKRGDFYTLEMHPDVVKLFGNREFARIDWGKRLQIEHQVDMAKWLQRLVATSRDSVQRYALDELKERMQYTGRMRDFKGALMAALRELERLEIIAKPAIETSTRGIEQAVWTRLASE